MIGGGGGVEKRSLYRKGHFWRGGYVDIGP